MPGYTVSFYIKFRMMKTIKYIILGIVILSMTMGSFSRTMGQDKVQFSETYTFREFTAHLDEGDQFFTLLELDQTHPEDALLGSCAKEKAEILWDHLHSASIQSKIPENLRFAWGWDSKDGRRTLFALRESTGAEAPGEEDIRSVEMSEGRQEGNYQLLLTFSDDGAKSWAAMTRKNVNRNIAIVVDGKVVTAPKVMQEIKMGKCLISGNFDKKEASDIQAILEGK